MHAARFLMDKTTPAISDKNGKRVAVTIPAGDTVKLIADPSPGSKMGDVLWEGRTTAGENSMPRSEKDRLAAEFEERWIDFQMALSDKRKYPVQQFRDVWEIGRRYAEMTKDDGVIHRAVVSAVNGMTDYLTRERKRVPEEVVSKAQCLESLVFAGYDSYFEGHEPPGL